MFYPSRDVSLDEEMVTCRSRFVRGVVYSRQPKPIPEGILIRSIADSRSGYMTSFMVVEKGKWKIDDSVVYLVQKLARCNHVVYMDNLYTSPALFDRLRSLPLPQYACGTWRSNKCPPEELSRYVGVKNKQNHLPRGEFTWSRSSTGLTGFAVTDTGPYLMLSSFHDESRVLIKRRVSGEREKQDFGAPKAAADYNKFMGGVDMRDHRRSVYTTHRRNAKWYKCLFTGFWTLLRSRRMCCTKKLEL